MKKKNVNLEHKGPKNVILVIHGLQKLFMQSWIQRMICMKKRWLKEFTVTTIDGKSCRFIFLNLLRRAEFLCKSVVAKDIMDTALKLLRNYFAKRLLLFHIRDTKNTWNCQPEAARLILASFIGFISRWRLKPNMEMLLIQCIYKEVDHLLSTSALLLQLI